MKPNIRGLKSHSTDIIVKNLLLIILSAGLSGTQIFAQTITAQASQLLTSYYGIKDALIAGDANTAASSTVP